MSHTFLITVVLPCICSLISGGVGIMVGYIYKRLKGLFQAVKANSHDKLFRYGKFYILSNEITMEELQSLEEIYKGYHGVGGNGTGTEIMERCRELPLVQERTKRNPYYTGHIDL